MVFHPRRHFNLTFFSRGAILVGFLLFHATAIFAAEISYHVINKQLLPGVTKWDCLSYDAASHRLFIAHGDQVDVFDTQKHKIVGVIPNTPGVHGIALAPDLDRGFASNGKDNSVSVFTLSSLKLINTIPTEKRPDVMLYEPTMKYVFAANAGSDSLSVIDAVKNKNIASIPLGGKPEFTVSDGKGKLFVNLEDKNQVVVVDTQKLTVTTRFDISMGCDEPSGLALDNSTQKLFISCHNQKMAVVDANTGKIAATLPIGRGTDGAIYDNGTRLAFSSNGDGTLTIIGLNGSDYQVKQTVLTMPTARTMALDPLSHDIYLVGAQIKHIDRPTKEKPFPRPQLKESTFTLITVSP